MFFYGTVIYWRVSAFKILTHAFALQNLFWIISTTSWSCTFSWKIYSSEKNEGKPGDVQYNYEDRLASTSNSNRPTSISLMNCIFFHMWPKKQKKNILEPIYVPKTNLLDSSPSPPLQGGLYYINPSFWANIKSLNSGLTSTHSTFSDIILTLYQL